MSCALLHSTVLCHRSPARSFVLGCIDVFRSVSSTVFHYWCLGTFLLTISCLIRAKIVSLFYGRLTFLIGVVYVLVSLHQWARPRAQVLPPVDWNRLSSPATACFRSMAERSPPTELKLRELGCLAQPTLERLQSKIAAIATFAASEWSLFLAVVLFHAADFGCGRLSFPVGTSVLCALVFVASAPAYRGGPPRAWSSLVLWHDLVLRLTTCTILGLSLRHRDLRLRREFLDEVSVQHACRRQEKQLQRSKRGLVKTRNQFLRRVAQHMADGRSWVPVGALGTGVLPGPDCNGTARESTLEPLDSLLHWEVQHADVHFSQRQLGMGSFGMVHFASFRGQPVAVKQPLDPSDISPFVTELSILSQVAHPNIARLVGACWNAPGVYLVIAHAPRGDLEACLHRETGLTWAVKLRMLLDVARGMAYLHAVCICHRDLKACSVLVDADYNCCIADFEHGCNFWARRQQQRHGTRKNNNSHSSSDHNSDSNNARGLEGVHAELISSVETPIHIAPEMLESEEQRPASLPQGDVYSFAMLQIMVSVSPFWTLKTFLSHRLVQSNDKDAGRMRAMDVSKAMRYATAVIQHPVHD